MANEKRSRTNFIGGLIEDNPLTNAAVLLTSTALASLPLINATNHAVIILDPDGVGGFPEIIYVTAHAAAATTATILRAQEGTVARSHLRDIPWIHGATIKDFDPQLKHPQYTPLAIGQKYNGNGCTGVATRTTGTALNVLIIGGPLFSGDIGVTLDLFDVNIVTAGAAGAVYRMGVWIIDNQVNPFAWALNVQWATLLIDLGTVSATTVGIKSISPAPAVVIPPNTWFAVGGVSQVAVCQPTIGASAGRFNPMGQGNATSGLVSTEGWNNKSNVPDVLVNLTQDVVQLNNIGHGVGFRRSA